MKQEELFHRDFRDALDHTVKLMGGTPSVGPKVWPAKTLEGADNWLQDCVSATRKAKLDLEEIVFLLKMARLEGKHDAFYQLCDEVGYARPQIVTPKTRRQVLAEQMKMAATEYSRLADEMAAIDSDDKLRVVK